MTTTPPLDRYVTHFQGDACRPPMGLAEHITWLQGQLEAIPAEHRGSAELEYEAPESYEQANGWLYIRYRRPETPEECAERWAAKRLRDAARRAAYLARKRWEAQVAQQQQDLAVLFSQPLLNIETGEVKFRSATLQNPAK